ncbi:NTP transferase domain-containing protein [Curtobacterium flaccumfaciens]|nr:NTP transferase domain-containing protein [Curtobacterium flaccumfaciens]
MPNGRPPSALRSPPGHPRFVASGACAPPVPSSPSCPRAGSKGIPGKNLRTVAGRSLVRRAVESARLAASIDEVVVTTDGDAIAAEAVASGAAVVRRPAELAGDEASSESALLHVLDAISTPLPEVLVFLQATSPFIDPADLDAAVARWSTGTPTRCSRPQRRTRSCGGPRRTAPRSRSTTTLRPGRAARTVSRSSARPARST